MNEIYDLYTLTPMQQGILFHSLRDQDKDTYISQISFQVDGDLDLIHFERAWQWLIERHSAFRTLFVWEDTDTPVQAVFNSIEFNMSVIDLIGLSSDQQTLKLKSFNRKERNKGFELTELPLMRVAVIKLSEESVHVVWTYHHIIMDGWSSHIAINELFTAYRDFCSGKMPEQPKVRPYRDYVNWLRQQDNQLAENFWRKYLKGITTPTKFHTFGTTDNGGKFQTSELYLSSEATDALQQYSREIRVTLATLVQGAWSQLLSIYSGDRDVLYGTTGSGRPHDFVGAENMIGLFISTLPTKVTIKPNMIVSDWLKEIQTQQIQAREYEYASLTDIHNWSGLSRNTALFEALFVFENYPIQSEPETDSHLKLGNVEGFGNTNYPLNLITIPGQRLLLKLLFNSNDFTKSFADDLLRHLLYLLKSLSQCTAKTLAFWTPLNEHERDRLLIDWNETSRPYADDKPVHELFEEQVERTPDAEAVVFEDVTLTYAELNRRGNQLAHYLRQQGVGPESLVAICMDRSVDLIVALLGVLKTGGAYVPLDPSYPQERFAYMLADTQPKVLVTESKYLLSVPSYTGSIVLMDGIVETLAE
ncbi:condensation domain-containing protein, partial [Paenibacillus sp. JCM 10914]|uniref:condensation domain-containing protein n=1 Tax=Paenibacillus sp. JCM 10914 TaxID=1236974 RepID=UPI000A716BA3